MITRLLARLRCVWLGHLWHRLDYGDPVRGGTLGRVCLRCWKGED